MNYRISAIARILLSGLIAAIVCAGLSFSMFFLLTVFDNQKLIEAFAYGLIVSVIGAVIGVIIGLAIGIGNLGLIGGGIAGVLGTLIVVAIYVFSAAESFDRFGYWLNQSRVIVVVLLLPTILTGVVTASLKKLIFKF
jgi:uncharacterized membrane protein (DUF485 family)